MFDIIVFIDWRTERNKHSLSLMTWPDGLAPVPSLLNIPMFFSMQIILSIKSISERSCACIYSVSNPENLPWIILDNARPASYSTFFWFHYHRNIETKIQFLGLLKISLYIILHSGRWDRDSSRWDRADENQDKLVSSNWTYRGNF